MNRRFKFNPSKALAGAIDWGVFFLASLMLFIKTAQVMTYFSPSSILGYTGIAPIYGMASALLVEGVLVLAKLSTKYSENGAAFLWNVSLTILTWTISAGAQIVDGLIVTGTLDTQPASVVFLVRAGVPLIPSLVLAAVLIKSTLASLPADIETPKPQQVRAQQPAARTVFASDTAGPPNASKRAR